MKKSIPSSKLSKKAKRQLDLKQRNTWGALNPVTRKPNNPKAYNRKKKTLIRWDDSDLEPFYFIFKPNISNPLFIAF